MIIRTLLATGALFAITAPAAHAADVVLTDAARACMDAHQDAIYAFNTDGGVVQGTDGDDTFCVSRDIDSSIIAGSAGDDTYYLLDNGSAPLRVFGTDDGNDTASLEDWTHAYSGDYVWVNTITADVENVRLTQFDDRLGVEQGDCTAPTVAQTTTYSGVGGSDTFYCVKGTVYGGTDADTFVGVVTGTVVYGGRGSDAVVGDAGADAINLGRGADTANVVGGGADTVNAGRGADTVFASHNDTVKSAVVRIR
jgi:hypothetical protein